MTISFIVAAGRNNVIGKNGQIPWNLPNDLKYFKNITWGMTVIMGRKTFESLGKPLPGRKNIVITRQPDWKAEGTVVVKNLDEAITAAEQTDVKEVFIIGGGEIFKMSFEKADKIYMTRVDAEPEGDAFFPEIDMKDWKLVSENAHAVDEKHQYAYSFQVWERK